MRRLIRGSMFRNFEIAARVRRLMRYHPGSRELR